MSIERLFRREKILGRLLLLCLCIGLLVGCNRGDESPAPAEATALPTPAAPAENDSAAPVAPPAEATTGPTVVPNGTTSVATPPPGREAEAAVPPTTGAEEPRQPVVSPLTGEIVLWHSWAGAQGDALAQILAEFNRIYPGVTVQTLFVAHDDLLQSYAEAVLADSGPTLILAPNWWLAEMVLLQLVTPIGPELAQSTREQLYPSALDSMVWQGQLYGLPLTLSVPALFVNTDLYSGPLPESLDELQSLAAANPQQGIGLYANLYHLAWGLSAFGAPLFDDAGRVILDESAGTAEFLAWLHTLNQLQGSYVDQDYGMLQDRFQKGEFAFFVDGPWSADGFNAALNQSLRVVPLPAGPRGESAPWVYTDGLFLSPNSDDAGRRVAVTLAQHLADTNAAELLARTGSLIPANRSVTLDSPALLAGFHAQAAVGQAMPIRSEMDAVWGYGGDMLLRALLSYPDLDPSARQSAYAELVAETSTLINEANGR